MRLHLRQRDFRAKSVAIGHLCHVTQLDAKASVIQRLIQRLVLSRPDIQAAGNIPGHLRGGEAGEEGSVVLLVGVEPGLEDRHLVRDPQGIEVHPPVGAGQPEPELLVAEVQLQHLFPVPGDRAQVLQRVKPRHLPQLPGGGNGSEHRILLLVHLRKLLSLK